ncbi:MAG TPA: diguanylate cyclase [Patescibacteria group bacterium]|nr:diguanylate cyclase [Patescibacteria group bacterium]
MKAVLWPLSLQKKLAICMWVMNMVLLFFSISAVLDAIAVHKRVELITKINYCSEPLFLTLEALAFERGRVNVVLSGEKTVDEVNRSFIAERRDQVDKHLTAGLERIIEFEPLLVNDLWNRYETLQRLRAQVDAQALVPLAARDPALSVEWFTQATLLIAQIQETIETLGKKEPVVDRFDFFHYFQLKCIDFRLFSGQSASILTSAINKGTALTPEKYQEFIESRGKADYIWRDIENAVAAFNTAELRQKRDRVYREYYHVYRPFQNEILPLALAGKAPVESAQRLAVLSVPAFDSIFELINEASIEKRRYVAQMNDQAITEVRMALTGFVLVILFIAITLGYFRKVLFGPLQRIVDTLRKIVDGQIVAELETDAARKDEIGLLARGVQLLQSSMQEERRLKKLNETLAVTDKLTGLYNRQMLDQTVTNLMAQTDRYGEPVSMILFDLDRFKRVNDTWGHPVGDAVLQQTALVVKDLIRSADLFFRFGGEEFLVLMPQTGEAGAVHVAEKIRVALEAVQHPLAGQVTVSLGVAVRNREESFDEWYKRTDAALYQAKSCGRNQTVYSVPTEMLLESEQLTWRSEWASGHREIDAQHQELLSRADAFFHVLLLPDAKPEKIQALLKTTLEKIASHFFFEENVLVEIGYPNADKHKLLHWQLLSQAVKLKKDYLTGLLPAHSFISFIVDDLVVGHMVKEDKLFFPYTKQKMEN